MVVTVPGLGSTGGGDETSAARPGSGAGASSAGSGGTITVTATASVTSGDGSTTTSVGPGTVRTITASGAPSTAGTAPSTAPASTAHTITAAPPRTAISSTTTGAPAGSVTVDLSHCSGCTVIATRADVTGTLSAALATTARGAVLLSVRPGGGIAGVINVPYGATFPVPSGKSLPCDRSGRCIVTGTQSNGHAVLSAFALSADGAWQDVSGNDGFPSATDRGVATDVNGDGLLDIAVQESAGGLTTWMVLTWSGDRFSVLGCAPDADTVPASDTLSPDSCLS